MLDDTPMTPEVWKKLDGLVLAALSQSPVKRAAFLQTACGGDEALQRDVEAQLAFIEQGQSFLEVPAFEHAAVLIAQDGAELLHGSVLGHYEIQRKIGAGGMGEVYLAHDTKLERTVALKILPASLAFDKGRLQRFTREAKSASALNHPNIITVHEIGNVDSTHFIVTEFVDGITLREKMRQGRMALKEILDVARQVAGAMGAAHKAGIVHRDIKPENIMVRGDGYVKVLDFGLAKLLEQHLTAVNKEATTKALFQTEPGMVMGTVEYMSPEQARGLELDSRTDIWSLGVVIYEMIAGRAPFVGETRSHVIVSILEQEPKALTSFASDIPAELQRVIRKTLTKDRDSRYQTSQDLIVDLKSLIRDLDIRDERRSLPPESGSDIGSLSQSQSAPRGRITQPTGNIEATRKALTEFGGFISRWRRVAIAATILAVSATAFLVWQKGRFVSIPSKPSSSYDSVAVLPIKSVGDNASDGAYLADGISELLITRLAQLPNLRVVPWVTSQQFRESKRSLQDMASEMRVKALITGTVRKSGDRIVVSVSLIDVDTGAQS
jgi:serine/threonine protein kinase